MTDLTARLRAVSLRWRTEVSRLTKMMNEYIATRSAEAAEKSFAKAEVYNQCAADLDALLGALETEPHRDFEALLADLKELMNLYDTDRVASQHARQIERIFDKWLGEDPAPPVPERRAP